jgi:hypothetical protein
MIADRATRVFRADIQGLVQGNALPELEGGILFEAPIRTETY